jgi:hypothetical protein
MHNFFNDSASFTKVLEGLQGARELMNEHITEEIESQMNEEQLAELQKARDLSDPKKLKAKAMQLMNSIKL